MVDMRDLIFFDCDRTPKFVKSSRVVFLLGGTGKGNG